MTDQVTFTVGLSTDTVMAGKTTALTITPSDTLPRDITVTVSVTDPDNVLTNSSVVARDYVFATGTTSARTITLDTLDTLSVMKTAGVRVTTTDAFTTISGATQTLTVTPPQITLAVSLNANIMGGTTAMLTVSSTNVSVVPRTVTLTISAIDPNNALSSTPTTLTINSGDSVGSVLLNTVNTLSTVATVTITVSDSDPFTTITGATQTLTVTPAQLTLAVSPIGSAGIVMGGTTAMLQVSATSGAVPRAITLTIDITDPSSALSSTPTILTIPMGESAGSVMLTTFNALSTVATVTITVSDSDPFTTITGATRRLTVTPQPVTLTVSRIGSAGIVMGGTTATLTVFASSGNVPRAITLDIGVIDPSNALSSTPTILTIPMGESAGSVMLTTFNTLSTVATVTITVSDSDPFTTITGATQTLTVTPQPVTLTVSRIGSLVL